MIVPLATSGCIVHSINFWKALFLYYDRPQVVNKKVSAHKQFYFYKIKYNNKSVQLNEVLTYTALIYESNKLNLVYTLASIKTLVESLLKPYDKNVDICEVNITTREEDGVFIGIRKLISRNVSCKDCIELVLFDKNEQQVRFIAGTSKNKYESIAPPFVYTFEHSNTGHMKLLIDIEDADTSSAEWLADTLFPKVVKWAEEYDPDNVSTPALSLISSEEYCTLYTELKQKYGKKMVEIWPENTDPLKFVYEDIAIASYLMCLWKQLHGDMKPTFADLGCGNGLLVYILNSEGYNGFGVDVRRRKIWDLYPELTDLRVHTLTPTDTSLFCKCDWIIGNHSDELTPWIPVYAALSSPTTHFFVLPCCAYNFDGTKYCRKQTSISQYSEYITFVEQIGLNCGFAVGIDKLKIPSTKRTCIVSLGRKNTNTMRIQEMIGSSIEKYKTRETIEKVKNCTQLDRNLISEIIKTVVNELLKDNNTPDERTWNSGRKLEIKTLVKAIDPNKLKQLKSECGGLQTLLRNHRYIFDLSNGIVKIRKPMLYADTQKYKNKPCWFQVNHPDGCLNSSETCAYLHS